MIGDVGMGLSSTKAWLVRWALRVRLGLAAQGMTANDTRKGLRTRSATRASYDSGIETRTRAWREWIAHARRLRVLESIACALVVACFVLIGVLGHDPWKQDETYTFGIIAHMLHTGDWVVPTNAGQPFMEKPPLYDWVAAGMAIAFGRWLPVFDAARLASACFTVVTLLFCARAARLFYRASQWRDARVLGAVALFASTFVVIKHVHDLMTDVALLAGASIALYGLMALVRTFEDMTRDDAAQARAARRHAALWLGLGVGIAMMSKGVFVPLVFGLAALGVPCVVPACRDRRFAFALLVALAVFLPFATIWPIALYTRSADLFRVWFWDNNIGRFVGFSVAHLGAENDERFFVLTTLLSSALPVGPLAMFGVLSSGWRRLRDPVTVVAWLTTGVGLAVLTVSATARQLYVLPFVPALALFAGDAIGRLPSRVHAGWDVVCRVVFAAAVTAVWAVWAVMTGPMENHWWLHGLARWLPLDYELETPTRVVVLAVVLTAAWGTTIGLAARAGIWRGVVSWAAGVAVLWGLVFSLLLPWIDYSKSYRSVFEDLSSAIRPYWAPGDCMASNGLGESEAPMLELFTGIEHEPIAPGQPTDCRWLIVQFEGVAPARPPGHWVPFWGGTRPGDTEQVIRVYRRSRASAASTSLR